MRNFYQALVALFVFSFLSVAPNALAQSRVIPPGGSGGLSATAVYTVFNVQNYGWAPDGTDHSAAMLAVLAAACPSGIGGGIIYFPPSTGVYRADSQMLLPNDGASPQQNQCSLRLTGAGGGRQWYGVGASVLDLRYTAADGNAKIETRGKGNLEIDHLTIRDGGAFNTTPFVHSVNTTLTIHEVTFIGTAWTPGTANLATTDTAGYAIGVGTISLALAGTGTIKIGDRFRFQGVKGIYTATSADADVSNGGSVSFTPTLTEAIPAAATMIHVGGQDAVVVGGHNPVVGGAVDSGFQGYGSDIVNNHFRSLNRGLYGLCFSNGINFERNSFQQNTGTVAIELDGSSCGGFTSYGNDIHNNLFEMDIYKYAVKMTSAQKNQFYGNQFHDAGANLVSYFYMGSVSTQNTIICGPREVTKPLVTGAIAGYLNTFLCTVGGASDSTGNGDQANEFAYGLVVKGTYAAADVYQGPLTVVSQDANTKHVSIGYDDANSRGVVEARIGSTGSPLYLNPVGLGRVVMPDFTVSGATSTNVSFMAGSAQIGNFVTWQWSASAGDTITLNGSGTVAGNTNAGGIKYQNVVSDATMRWTSDHATCWNSTTTLASGLLDVCIKRNTAGKMEVNNGTAGVFRDWQLRAVQYSTGARPICDASARGTTWYVAGGAGVLDTFEICRKDAADVYAWVTLF